MIEARCPICRDAATTVSLRGLYDDRYGYPGIFDLRHCAACDHRFLDATFSAEQLSELYTRYYPRAKLDLESWRPAPRLGVLRTWLGRARSAAFRWVPRGVKILDIGCGSGESLAYHAARGCEAHGVEADENIRAVAARFHLNVRVGLFHSSDFPRSYFDVVTLDQVIEHAADPVALLRDAALVLRPGGIILLTTPNSRSLTSTWFGRRWVHFHTPYHLQLFSTHSLKQAATAAGLQVEWLRHITPPRWFAFQWIHLISYPQQGVSSKFWNMATDWPFPQLVARKTFSAFGKLGLNHLTSMFLDAFCVGDNLVMRIRKERD